MVMNTGRLNLARVVSDARVRTLVVDDSRFMLKILTQTLERAGKFDVVGTATDGCQAVRYVSMLSPELVLMDVHMPRLSGIQATRCIKQREHPPAVIMVTSDDSPVTKATAEEAGADGFISKQGNLRLQLIGVLQDLFGFNGTNRATTWNTVNDSLRLPNKLPEAGLGCSVTQERFDSALGKLAIQATGPGEANTPCGTHALGSAQRPQARCPHANQHSVGRSLCQTNAGSRQSPVQLCASSRIQPARKAGANTYDAMKTRKPQSNTKQEKAKTTVSVPPTIEEIRRRAHELFLARGGMPGNELQDWVRAEQELKQGRAGTDTNTT